MSEMALLQWRWVPDAPLHSGYGRNLAEFAGRMERGERASVNLETRSAPDRLEPAFLASSVKGVFRAAAAWLLERTARQLGATRYVTRDFNEALEERYEGQRGRRGPARLCPLDRAFGGSAGEDSGSYGALRLKSPVSFTFNDAGAEATDAFHGPAAFGPEYLFVWQTLLNKGKTLRIEQLTAGEVSLLASLQPVEPAHVALLWLAGDVISSGAFRFGRFTSRGYGVVRLRPSAYRAAGLAALLDGQPPAVVAGEASGYATARAILQRDPLDVLQAYVRPYL